MMMIVGLPVECGFEDVLAGCSALLVGRFEGRIGVRSELHADFAPQGVRGLAARGDAVDGVERVTHDGGDVTVVRNQIRVDELAHVVRPCAVGQVVHGDEAVRLAATETGFAADQAMLGAGHPSLGEATEGACQERAKTFRGIGQFEELLRVAVGGVPARVADDSVELGGEVRVGQSTVEHVASRGAVITDAWQVSHQLASRGVSQMRWFDERCRACLRIDVQRTPAMRRNTSHWYLRTSIMEEPPGPVARLRQG